MDEQYTIIATSTREASQIYFQNGIAEVPSI